MIFTCAALYVILLIVYLIIAISRPLYNNAVPTMTPDMASRVLESSDYRLGDNPYGVAWFIQTSDLHIGLKESVAPAFKFESSFFYFYPYLLI